MSDEYSNSPERIKLDADLTQQINDSRNNDDNIAQGSSHRDNMSSAAKTSSDASDDDELGSSNSDNMSSADETSSDERYDDEFGSSNSDNMSSADETSSDASDDDELGSSNSDNMSSADETSSDERYDDEFGSSNSDNMSSADETSSDASDDDELGSSNSDNMSSADETSSDERKTFSCYDVLNSEWLEDAEEEEECRIYVHLEILDWIVSLINKNILNEDVRATVEEVFHHNLNGQVYLIKFYITWRKYKIMEKTLLEYIKKLKGQLKYKCVWEKRPTYFLKIDSKFDERKIEIMSELRKLNLHESFEATSLEVNWLYIPKIEKYEFPEYLTDDQTHKIDLIFDNMSESLSSLYICKQFEWHKDRVVGRYVDVDTLAMDICAEEWNRHDLLKEFGLDNLLDLDLAYKDYRNEFLNGYMERYIHKSLLKLMPKLSSDYDGKLEFDLFRLRKYANNYFISKFYNKIILWDGADFNNLGFKHDIPKLSRKEMAVDLKFDKPTPDEMLMMELYSDIVYNISNYNYFSDSLFRTLLNKPSVSQKFNISFGTDFQFEHEKNNKISPLLCHFSRLHIHLLDCTENNAEQLAIFMKYIFNLCKDIQHQTAQIFISFNNCVLDDYSFLESIDRSIYSISFTNMNFPSSQFELLSRFLTQQRMVNFEGCNITDTNVMTLLENINLRNLYLDYGNACTPAVFFLMAEHLLNEKSGNNPIGGMRFFSIGIYRILRNMNLDPDDIEFFKTDDQIVIREKKSKKNISSYDESFDPIYNVYAE